MLTFYFTGTGNSLAAAKKIGGTLISIPQAIHEENKIYRDDAIGFVFPLYCLNPPKMVREFLQNAKFEADYFFAVATYGNATGAALPHLQRAAEELGLRFDYINALLSVDNCLPYFEMGEEVARLPAKRTEECLEQIAADIAARKRFIPAATAEDEALSAYRVAGTDQNHQNHGYDADITVHTKFLHGKMGCIVGGQRGGGKPPPYGVEPIGFIHMGWCIPAAGHIGPALRIIRAVRPMIFGAYR